MPNLRMYSTRPWASTEFCVTAPMLLPRSCWMDVMSSGTSSTSSNLFEKVAIMVKALPSARPDHLNLYTVLAEDAHLLADPHKPIAGRDGIRPQPHASNAGWGGRRCP